MIKYSHKQIGNEVIINPLRLLPGSEIVGKQTDKTSAKNAFGFPCVLLSCSLSYFSPSLLSDSLQQAINTVDSAVLNRVEALLCKFYETTNSGKCMVKHDE